MGERGELDLSGARHSTSMWLGKVTSSSEEEDTIIGPMPAKGPVESDVTKEFERRAQRMKGKTYFSRQFPRQSWMTELPPGLKSVGFGPRIVRRGADDKSGIGSIWTDTPADRERKAKESKRSESLLDMHQKKLKSKASEEKTKPQERRPFDREQDLKVNRFDEAQKKALIRKSRDLNSKFEHSKGNMFL